MIPVGTYRAVVPPVLKDVTLTDPFNVFRKLRWLSEDLTGVNQHRQVQRPTCWSRPSRPNAQVYCRPRIFL